MVAAPNDPHLAAMPAVLDEPHAIAVDAVARHARRLAAERDLELATGEAIAELDVVIAVLVDDALVREPDVAPAGRREWSQLSSRARARTRAASVRVPAWAMILPSIES